MSRLVAILSVLTMSQGLTLRQHHAAAASASLPFITQTLLVLAVI